MTQYRYEDTAKPGVQNPGKYKVRPGPNYAQWGEQPGYIYNPYTDHYDKPHTEQEMYEAGVGKKPAGDPSLLGTVGVLAGAGLAAEGGKALGQSIPGLLSTGGGEAAGAIGGQAASGALTTGTAATEGALGTGFMGAPGVAATPLTLGEGAATAGAPTAAGGSLLSSVAVPAAVAAATYLGGKSLLNTLAGKADNSTQGKIGRGLLGIATGGLSEIGRKFLVKPTTKDIQKKNTKGLLELGKDDANWQNYVTNMRAQVDTGPADRSKPFAGQYSSFDEYKKAGLRADDLTGVLGNLKTFGPEWAKLSFDQQKAVTQKLIDNNMYSSKKGEVIVTDAEKAKQLKNEALGIKPASASVVIPDKKVIVAPKGLMAVGVK